MERPIPRLCLFLSLWQFLSFGLFAQTDDFGVCGRARGEARQEGSSPAPISAKFIFADKLRFLQYEPASELPCFQLIVNLADDRGNPLELIVKDPTKEMNEAIDVCENSIPLTNVCAIVEGSDKRKNVSLGRYTLILLDYSGSMFRETTGDGRRKMETAKQACENFTLGFMEGRDHVAVIPFSSRKVRAIVENAPFAHSQADLMRQLRRLNCPVANTGLYGAILFALTRIQTMKNDFIADQDIEPEFLLVVMTDGKNFLATGDDPDLPNDWRGIKAVEESVGVQVLTIGFGEKDNLDEDTLKKIAWPDSASYHYAAVAQDLIKSFAVARKFQIERIKLLFIPQEKRRDQLIWQKRFTINFTYEKPPTRATEVLLWTPPGLATPPFEGIVSERDREAFARLAQPSRSKEYPQSIFGFLFMWSLAVVVFTLLYLFFKRIVPRRMWKKDYDTRSLYKILKPFLNHDEENKPKP